MMCSLSFVGGSKSAVGGSGFGPGGPNLGGSKSAGTTDRIVIRRLTAQICLICIIFFWGLPVILNWLKYKTFAVQIILESNINHTERKSLVLKTMTAILLINETKTNTGNLSVLVGFKFIQFLTIIVQIRTYLFITSTIISKLGLGVGRFCFPRTEHWLSWFLVKKLR